MYFIQVFVKDREELSDPCFLIEFAKDTLICLFIGTNSQLK